MAVEAVICMVVAIQFHEEWKINYEKSIKAKAGSTHHKMC